MGTCQSDPLGGTLFALTHFKALCFIVNRFPSCLFLSIIDNSHIKNPTQLYHFDMNTFKPNFCVVGLLSNLRNVLYGLFLACRLTSTPHPILTSHCKELKSWGFHWALHH